MHNFEAFFMLELNDFKFKGLTKRKTKSYKNLPNREKHSNQITIIDKTEPKKLEKQNGKSSYL